VASDPDESKASTLPDPELNPLLNPLLAAHMGRWAEVYFTSPPEKRGQAIAELLRELEKNPPSNSGSTLRKHDENISELVEKRAEKVPSLSSLVATGEPASICRSCGYSNSALQRFCGMCGTPLTNSSRAYSQQFAEAEPTAAASWSESESRFEGGRDPGETEEREDSQREDAVESMADSDFVVEDYSLPSLREQSPADLGILSEHPSKSVPHSYRIYAGVALAVLLALLVYMAWRGNAAFWNSRTAPPDLPQAVPMQQSESPPATSAPGHRGPTTNTMPANAPLMLPANTRSSTLAPNPIGSEELATAEKYLNGGPDVARDSRQAATWLWKAVAKQNLTATMLLSDLYLRGDGVPKSCDQARLLLDAAARKGGAAAAERLRNLPAFGCQ